VAFSQTYFTGDLKKISVPTLVMQGDNDQVVRSTTRVPDRQAGSERDNVSPRV
jgi:pimeloyl-ACP methyl ester carboxylesterase